MPSIFGLSATRILVLAVSALMLSACFDSNVVFRVAVPNADQMAQVGVAFSYDASQSDTTFEQRDGQMLSYRIELSAPSLGLQASDSIVSGTPSGVGTVTVTIIATDQNGTSVTDQFEIIVSGADPTNQPPVVSNPNANQTATTGVAFSYDATRGGTAFSDADGDALTYSIVLSSPSNGLSASGGTISGTPTAAGTVTATITANDGNGGTASDSFSIAISDPTPGNQSPTVSNANANQAATAGTPFSYDATQGGTTFSDPDGDSLTYSIALSSPSNGLSASGGTISGMPTAAGTVVATITANDGNGGTASNSFDIVITGSVNSPPTVRTPNPDQAATVGTAFNYDATQGGSTFTDADGDSLTHSTVLSSPSNGLMASGGVVSGTPTAAGTVTATITADDGNGGSVSDSFDIVITEPASDVTISGNVTFARVPQKTTGNTGLDYANTRNDPVRGATVEALNSAGSILATGKTDVSGDYSLVVPPSTDVRIRVKAEMVQTDTPAWNVAVVDNTNSQALYVLDGNLTDSGTANSTRNLNAPSGWGGSSYTSTRAAGPFAILDSIYLCIQKVVAVDATVVFPPLNVNWSVNNVPTGGNLSTGMIGTSFYNGQLYILGAENNDTDEYDGHIIIHEWSHYFEDKLSRSDSIGGQHTGSDRLDMRVAFGEGFGNGLSGIMTDDPFYRDTRDAMQNNGFSFSVDNNAAVNEGWYNEASVQAILYDLYDSGDESGVDTVSLGFGPIYDILVDEQRSTPFFTSIFTFITALKADNAGSAAAIDTLVADQTIVSSTMNATGSTETNDAGGTANVLPVYTPLTVNGGAVNVCVISDFGTYNKLSNRRFLQFTVNTAGEHTFTATRTSGFTPTDPDIAVFKDGVRVLNAISGTQNSELGMATLSTGTHVIDFSEFVIGSGNAAGTACFDISVSM